MNPAESHFLKYNEIDSVIHFWNDSFSWVIVSKFDTNYSPIFSEIENIISDSMRHFKSGNCYSNIMVEGYLVFNNEGAFLGFILPLKFQSLKKEDQDDVGFQVYKYFENYSIKEYLKGKLTNNLFCLHFSHILE